MSELLDLRMELRRLAQALESSNEAYKEQLVLTRRLVELREDELERARLTERRWIVSQRKLHVDGCDIKHAWEPCACPLETTEKREY